MARLVRILLLLMLSYCRTFGQVPEGQFKDPSFLLLVDRFIDSVSFYDFPDRLIVKAEISKLTETDSIKIVDSPFGKVQEKSSMLSYIVRLSLVQNSNEFRINFPSSFFDYKERRVYVFLEEGYLFEIREQDREKLMRDVKKHLGREVPGNSVVAFMGGRVDGGTVLVTKLRHWKPSK